MKACINFLRKRFSRMRLPGSPGWQLQSSSGAPSLGDDAYHFDHYAGSPDAAWYTEWWYFNFIDDASGLSGIITIACFNPADHRGLGLGMLTLAIVDGATGDVPQAIEYYPISEFRADKATPDVMLAGRNSVKATSATTFAVKAAARDGSINVDLNYVSADTPVFLARDVHGQAPDPVWEVSSWLVYMPCARVTGRINFRGRQIDLQNAKGYHDHDWGMWHEYARTWSWAAFYSPDKQLSFDFGLHAAFQESVAYLRVGGIRELIKDGSFTFTQLDWKSWMLFWKYPRRMSYQGTTESGLYTVSLNWVVRDTVKLWKQAMIVFEQTAHFTGEVRAAADGTLVAAIDETGFCEYTATWS
jgi:hypothetical protein